jgi:hypothetical protein
MNRLASAVGSEPCLLSSLYSKGMPEIQHFLGVLDHALMDTEFRCIRSEQDTGVEGRSPDKSWPKCLGMCMKGFHCNLKAPRM